MTGRHDSAQRNTSDDGGAWSITPPLSKIRREGQPGRVTAPIHGTWHTSDKSDKISTFVSARRLRYRLILRHHVPAHYHRDSLRQLQPVHSAPAPGLVLPSAMPPFTPSRQPARRGVHDPRNHTSSSTANTN